MANEELTWLITVMLAKGKLKTLSTCKAELVRSVIALISIPFCIGNNR